MNRNWIDELDLFFLEISNALWDRRGEKITEDLTGIADQEGCGVINNFNRGQND